MRKFMLSLQIQKGRGYRVDQNYNGTVLHIEPGTLGQPSSSEIKQFKVNAVSYDYVDCHVINGDTVGTTTYRVAKPHDMRKTPWDGREISYQITRFNLAKQAFTQTVTVQIEFLGLQERRLKAQGTNTVLVPYNIEDQAITPRYMAGLSVIFGMKLPEGISLNGSPSGIDWIDLNIDGRSWAKMHTFGG